MSYRIWKRFEFSASHVLEGLAEGHQCGRMHGHNYVVELELERRQLDGVGFVVDYGEMASFKALIDTHLDHRHLNDQLPDLNPTAEVLAHWLWDRARDMAFPVSAVRVYETPKTCAEYRQP